MRVFGGATALHRVLTWVQRRAITYGVRREDKIRWERRAPLSPADVRELVKSGHEVLVEPSAVRAFPDRAYAEAGARLTSDLSSAQVILAVKEVPLPKLLADKTYVFFSHTIKAQPHNMRMLDEVLDKRIRLMDYECIVDAHDQRLVKFGRFAGLAGMLDTFTVLGDRLLAQGQSTPFLAMGFTHQYRDRKHVDEALGNLARFVAEDGVPESLRPLTFVVTGDGAVAKGALEIIEKLGMTKVRAEDLPELARTKGDPKKLYYCVATAKDMVRAKDAARRGAQFDMQHYLANPGQYEPVFHENVLPHTSVLVNCIFWRAEYPRLVTNEQMKALYESGRNRLVMVQDISCDIEGSVQFTSRAATIDEPTYVYNPSTGETSNSVYAPGILLQAVDNLPAEMARDATEAFGSALVPYLRQWTKVDSPPVELQRATVTSGGKLTERFQYIASLREKTRPRRVLVLGAGMVAGPAVDYLVKKGYEVTVAAESEAIAEALLQKRGYGKKAHVAAAAANVSEAESGKLAALVERHDAVLSLVPAFLHPLVARACIEKKRHMVTASYASPQMLELDGAARAAGVTVLNELGLDPGFDHMTAQQVIDKTHEEGGHVETFLSYCGGLPAPENANNPFGYKFSWSPRGVLVAAKASARLLENGQLVENPYALAMARPMSFWPAFNLEGYPNRDSTPYVGRYRIPEAHSIVRGTLRYGGFAEIMLGFNKLGLLDETPNSKLAGRGWADVVGELVGETSNLVAACERRMGARAAHALAWLGLVDKSAKVTRSTLLDSLCDVMQAKLAMGPADRDLVLMHHELGIRNRDGSRVVHKMSLCRYGDANGGDTAMAVTVGLPAAMGVNLVLQGYAAPGMQLPMSRDVYTPILADLAQHGVFMEESTVAALTTAAKL